MTDLLPLLPDDDEPFDLLTEPLDRPTDFGHDWGGDGSDLIRPVRAHVLAALRPNTAPYPPPVDELVRLGDPHIAGVEERRNALGLAQEHVPDLLRMARDRALYTANSESLEVWAPLHAIEILKELDLSNDVAELIPLFDLQDDWNFSNLPKLMATIGEPAIEPLHHYLADHSRWAVGHSIASDALENIAAQNPTLRAPVVEILSDVLRDAENYHEVAVTGAMDSLVELGAVEALPLIRHAFEVEKIDEMMRGPWGDVLHDLGLEAEDDDPLVADSLRRYDEHYEAMFPSVKRTALSEPLDRLQQEQALRKQAEDQRRATRAAAQAKERKQKNKRKQQSASRKANRKKR